MHYYVAKYLFKEVGIMEIQGVSSPRVLEQKKVEPKKQVIREEKKEVKENTLRGPKLNNMKIERKEDRVETPKGAKQKLEAIKEQIKEKDSLKVHDKIDEIRDKALSTLS